MIYQISYPISDLSNQVLGGKIFCRSAVCFTEEGPVWPELPPTAQHSVVRVETRHLPSLAWRPRSLARFLRQKAHHKLTSYEDIRRQWKHENMASIKASETQPSSAAATKTRPYWGSRGSCEILSPIGRAPHHRLIDMKSFNVNLWKLQPRKSQNQDKRKLLS